MIIRLGGTLKFRKLWLMCGCEWHSLISRIRQKVHVCTETKGNLIPCRNFVLNMKVVMNILKYACFCISIILILMLAGKYEITLQGLLPGWTLTLQNTLLSPTSLAYGVDTQQKIAWSVIRTLPKKRKLSITERRGNKYISRIGGEEINNSLPNVDW